MSGEPSPLAGRPASHALRVAFEQGVRLGFDPARDLETVDPTFRFMTLVSSGWLAARPSGTEDIYKIYAESFRGEEHLRILLREAQQVVDRALEDG